MRGDDEPTRKGAAIDPAQRTRPDSGRGAAFGLSKDGDSDNSMKRDSSQDCDGRERPTKPRFCDWLFLPAHRADLHKQFDFRLTPETPLSEAFIHSIRKALDLPRRV